MSNENQEMRPDRPYHDVQHTPARDNNNQPLVRMEKVVKSFGRQVVLAGVDLQVHPGKTTVVIGPSGCGKSVLLKTIIGLLKPDSGKVYFHDEEISSMNEQQMLKVRRQIGFLFQGAALFDSMSVEGNIMFPLEEHSVGTLDERRQRAREVLQLVGLDGIQPKFPGELSGGQKKRVALARAIALGPELILYDEPTTGLDPIRADLINELILKLKNILGVTAMVVTHDMASARKVGDRIMMLHNGRFIVDSTPAELDRVDNEVVARFIEGRASKEELAELNRGQLSMEPNNGSSRPAENR